MLNTLQKLLLQGSGSIHRILGCMTMRKFGEQPWKEIPVGTIKPACVCVKNEAFTSHFYNHLSMEEVKSLILQFYRGTEVSYKYVWIA